VLRKGRLARACAILLTAVVLILPWALLAWTFWLPEQAFAVAETLVAEALD
jgi:hypothetical protein